MLEVGLPVKLNFPASTFIIMQSCENLTSAHVPWWTGTNCCDGPNQAGLSVPQLLSPGIQVSFMKAVFIAN